MVSISGSSKILSIAANLYIAVILLAFELKGSHKKEELHFEELHVCMSDLVFLLLFQPSLNSLLTIIVTMMEIIRFEREVMIFASLAMVIMNCV